jgi:osmotically inducible protein OsmC
MAEFKRSATSTWTGDLRGGNGVVSTESGALKDAKVTFVSRFENAGGSNPEELVAAAHAACFSMALSADHGRAGPKPESITTNATVILRMEASGPKVAKIHLETEGRVPGIDQATFAQVADGTKTSCPISRLLTPGLEEVTVNARLVQ